MDDLRIQALSQFTPKGLTPGYGQSYVFSVGRDDCHGILHYLLQNEGRALKLAMFGFDDDQLNQDIIDLMKNPSIRVQATLDKSQAGGVHERKILAMDEASNPNFLNSFAIGQSATHQISHSKSGVFIGQGLFFTGSMNWSASGEGTGISLKPGIPDPKGYVAQNNDLLISANPVLLSNVGEELDKEHLVARAQMGNNKVA